MTQADVLAWTVPLTMAGLGAIFLAVHLHTRSALWWAIGYFVLAAAFAVDIVQTARWAFEKAVAGDALFILALAASTRAISLRYGRPPHDGAVLLYCVAAVATVLAASGSVSAQLIMSHLACAGLQLFAARQMLGRLRRPVDRVLLAVMLLVAADILARVALFNWFATEAITFDTWRNSRFAFAFQVTSSLLGIFFAFTVFFAIGLDVIEKLRRTLNADPLTGALNRYGFREHTERALRTPRHPFRRALVIADIDHFKRVNDLFGHAAGDTVIRDLTAVLSHLAAGRGHVGRLGGEEFALFLKDAPLDAALEIAETARLVFSEMTDGGEPSFGRLSASFGVMELRPGETLDEALERADRQLYRAKRARRNRVMAEPFVPFLDEAA